MEIKSLQIKLGFFVSFVFFCVCVDLVPLWRWWLKVLIFSLWGFFFKDIDECTSNNHNCDINAFCNNTEGSHNCTCKPGYSGDGSNCTGNDVFYSFLVYRHISEVLLKLDFVTKYFGESFGSLVRVAMGIRRENHTRSNKRDRETGIWLLGRFARR